MCASETGAEERQRFPSLCPALLEYSAEGYFGGIGGESESCIRARVVKHGCFRKSFFCCLKCRFAFWGPVEFPRLALQGVEEEVEVLRCISDVSAIIADHAKKSLEFFDGGRGFGGANCFDLVREGCDAVFSDVEPEEVQFANSEYTFGPVNDQAVFGEEVEDLLEVCHVFFRRVGEDENVVEIHITEW